MAANGSDDRGGTRDAKRRGDRVFDVSSLFDEELDDATPNAEPAAIPQTRSPAPAAPTPNTPQPEIKSDDEAEIINEMLHYITENLKGVTRSTEPYQTQYRNEAVRQFQDILTKIRSYNVEQRRNIIERVLKNATSIENLTYIRKNLNLISKDMIDVGSKKSDLDTIFGTSYVREFELPTNRSEENLSANPVASRTTQQPRQTPAATPGVEGQTRVVRPKKSVSFGENQVREFRSEILPDPKPKKPTKNPKSILRTRGTPTEAPVNTQRVQTQIPEPEIRTTPPVTPRAEPQPFPAETPAARSTARQEVPAAPALDPRTQTRTRTEPQDVQPFPLTPNTTQRPLQTPSAAQTTPRRNENIPDTRTRTTSNENLTDRFTHANQGAAQMQASFPEANQPADSRRRELPGFENSQRMRGTQSTRRTQEAGLSVQNEGQLNVDIVQNKIFVLGVDGDVPVTINSDQDGKNPFSINMEVGDQQDFVPLGKVKVGQNSIDFTFDTTNILPDEDSEFERRKTWIKTGILTGSKPYTFSYDDGAPDEVINFIKAALQVENELNVSIRFTGNCKDIADQLRNSMSDEPRTPRYH